MVVLQKDYGVIWEQESLYFARSLEPEEFVERIIKRASKSFEYQFGIKLVLVEIETWYPQSQTTAELFKELKSKTTLENCDVIIGFSGRVKDRAALGLASLPQEETLGNYILILPSFPKDFEWIEYVFNSYRLQSYVLIHELGHNFGAVHPNEIHAFPNFPKIESTNDVYKLDALTVELLEYLQKSFSVMNPGTEYLTTNFDEYNKEIIFKNKYLPSK